MLSNMLQLVAALPGTLLMGGVGGLFILSGVILYAGKAKVLLCC